MLKTFEDKYYKVCGREELTKDRKRLKEFDHYDYKTELIGNYFGVKERMKKLAEEYGEVLEAYLYKSDDDFVEELVDLKVVADTLINMAKQNKRGKKIYKHKVDRTIRQINEGIL